MPMRCLARSRGFPYTTKQGKPTGEHCIVVYVSQKIPSNQLNEDEILPSHVEGVPVDIVEAGQVEALSL